MFVDGNEIGGRNGGKTIQSAYVVIFGNIVINVKKSGRYSNITVMV